MNRFKKSASTLAVSATLAAFALATHVTIADQATAPQEEDGRGITPQPIGSHWSGGARGETFSSSAFIVPIHYGHVKVWFYNQDSQPVTVTVTHMDSRYPYFTQTISAGQSFTWRSTANYLQGMRSGHYNVSYHSATGNVNVQFSGFASDRMAEANR